MSWSCLRPKPLRTSGNQFLVLDVPGHDLDQHRGLRGEALVVGVHRRELRAQHLGHVMFLGGLQHVLLHIRQQRADLGIYPFGFQIAVHRIRLEDARHGGALARWCRRGLEFAEQPTDLLVVFPEQDDGIRRHRYSFPGADTVLDYPGPAPPNGASRVADALDGRPLI